MKSPQPYARSAAMSGKPELKVDWATHAAAKYACENWHYSRTVPVGKKVVVGVWESGTFIGVVVFAWGMNKSLVAPYRLPMTAGCELVRVALTDHYTPVSKILKLALVFLKKQCPGTRLVVSFADPCEGHHGGIYQATNWVYTGKSQQSFEYRAGGKRLHKRAYTGKNFSGKGASKLPPGAEKVSVPGKHRYLMPLDKEMAAQIEPLRRPYPKRPTKANSADQVESGGAIPTRTLQILEGDDA